MEKWIKIYLLGILQVVCDGQLLNGFRSRKALALLGYLAAHEQAVPRTQLVELFWPEMEEKRGRANLSWAINHLSESLPNLVIADRHSVGLRTDADKWVDIHEFSELMQQVESDPSPGAPASIAALTQASELYRGDFMSGHYLDDCPNFEQWLIHQQENWRQRIQKVLHTLSAHHQRRGDDRSALRVVDQWLSHAPWQEEAHQRKMELLAASGHWSLALQQYEQCRRTLKEELGVAPSAETTRLYERIQQRDARLLKAQIETTRAKETADGRSGQPLAHNLPRPSSSFVGRQREIEQIIRWLNEPTCKLVTIFGPGGIGKTRLALAVARNILNIESEPRLPASKIQHPAFPDGICFVSLAAVDDPAQTAQTIAKSLGLQFGGNTTARQAVIHYLQDKNMLLVMDNHEHLPVDLALFEEILQPGWRVKVLTTSRQKLNLQLERVFELEGLPHTSPSIHSTQAMVDPAVELFLERTERISQLVADTNNLALIQRICQLVEGFPLGIELAAALASFMPLNEIATELARNLDILSATLTDPPNPLLDRHQSLRAAFETSWKLLRAQEQQVLSRLAIFRGGFDWQAVQAVAHPAGAELAALVNKSLLRLRHNTSHGVSRYEIHELLRQYAAEQMSDQDEVAAVHASYFADFVQKRECALMNDGQKIALGEIEREIGNIRLAWNWAVTKADASLLGKFCRGIALYFDMRGPFDEAERSFGRAIAAMRASEGQAPNQQNEVMLLRLLVQQARFCRVANNQTRTKNILNEALAISERPHLAADREVQLQRAEALTILGHLSHYLGENAFAEQCLESSLRQSQESQLPWLRAETLAILGMVAQYRGEFQHAQQIYQESLLMRRELGDLRGIGLTLGLLGYLYVNNAEYVRADLHLQEAIALWRELGDRNGEANVLNLLGANALTSGSYRAAERYLLESLAIYQANNHQVGMLRSLSNLGYAYNRLGDYHKAQEYLHSALELERALGSQRSMAFTLRHLGESHLRLQNIPESRRYFQKALLIAQDIAEIPLQLLVINATTQLLTAENQSERAIEYISMILSHSATEPKVRQQAERSLTEISSTVDAATVDAALERGKKFVLKEIVQIILSETG